MVIYCILTQLWAFNCTYSNKYSYISHNYLTIHDITIGLAQLRLSVPIQDEYGCTPLCHTSMKCWGFSAF